MVGIKDDTIVLKEIFSFKQTGLTEKQEVYGEFLLHKYIPKVYDKLKARGIDNLIDIFGK